MDRAQQKSQHPDGVDTDGGACEPDVHAHGLTQRADDAVALADDAAFARLKFLGGSV
jgi:hypothetical protein